MEIEKAKKTSLLSCFILGYITLIIWFYWIATQAGLIYYFHVIKHLSFDTTIFITFIILFFASTAVYLLINASLKAFPVVSVFWYVLKDTFKTQFLGRSRGLELLIGLISLVLMLLFGPILFIMEKLKLLKKENIREPGNFTDDESFILTLYFFIYFSLSLAGYIFCSIKMNSFKWSYAILILFFVLLFLGCLIAEIYRFFNGVIKR